MHNIERRIARLRELKAGFEQEWKCVAGGVGAMWQLAEKSDYRAALSGIVAQIDAAIAVLKRVQRGETRPLGADELGGAYPPSIPWEDQVPRDAPAPVPEHQRRRGRRS